MASPSSPLPRPAVDHIPLSPSPDLRLVLLGRKGAGKSAAGNTILGAGFELGKPTEECIKRRADVDGLKVTVVDTPGWEWYYPLNSTPNWVRRETLRSVTLCPPGPHAVLLVIRSCASVNEDYIKEIEEHLLPLGMKVWEHTMVLFTRGDELGLVSMEQRIQTSPGLQTLLCKCGRRYHVMETRVKNDQVKQLMQKLRKMVEEKEEREYLEINSFILSELDADGLRRASERRKRQRQMEAQAQRGTIKTALMSDSLTTSESDSHHSFSKTPRRLPEIRLIILGERETGKSSAANSIFGHSGLFQSGAVTEESVCHQATLSMRQVTLVDTPGWDGGVMGSTPERVKRELVSSVVLCQPGPHAFLVTLRVDTTVRESHIREHLELLGENIWKYTILLFTHCDQLREGVSIEQHIQRSGKDLHTLLEKCRGRYHALSNLNGLESTAHVTELLEKVEKMAATNRCEAFSGLVQEVKTLSQQRNEKQSQRFKELQDKMSRQETELKKLRDREMKSLRWLFDWKKKSKSAGNSKKEEEVDEEKSSIEENLEDLQERMRLLIDDKEREIQDLHVEHERILVKLHQSRREAQEAGHIVEIKEREIDELNERIDEQQAKILDLERIAVGHEQEKQVHKKVVQEWHKTVQQVKMVTRETEEWKERAGKLEKDLEQAKRLHDENVKKITQEKDMAIKDLAGKLDECTEMLTEKEKDVEQLRNIANDEKQKVLDQIDQNEQGMQKEMDELILQHEREKNELRQNLSKVMEEKMCEMDNKLENMRVQHFEETQQILKQHQNKLNEQKLEIESLKEQLVCEAKANMETKQNELAEMEQKYIGLLEETSQEHKKDLEIIIAINRREMEARDNKLAELKGQYQEEIEKFEKECKEKENKIEALRERRKTELEKNVSQLENCKKLCNALKDRELQDLKCKYTEEIGKKDKDIEQILKERAEETNQLNLKIEQLKLKLDDMVDVYAQVEEKDQMILDLNESLKEVKDKLEEMEHMKEQEQSRMAREKDNDIEALRERYKVELEEKVSELENCKKQYIVDKDREIQDLKCKYMDEMDKKDKDNEQILKERVEETNKLNLEIEELKHKLGGMVDVYAQVEEKEQMILDLKHKLEDMEQEQSRMARESEEKDNDIEVLREGYKAELERKVSELENCRKLWTVEKDGDIQDLKCKYMDEMDKKDKDIEQILKERVEETNKLNLEIEELKLKLDDMVDVYAKVEEKEQMILDLNESLKEVKDKLEEMEHIKELEQSRIARESEEKDNDVEALRERYKVELEEKVSELENCKKQCVVDKDMEIQDLKSKYMNEMDKKDKDIEKILKERIEETNKLNLEIEELKLKLDDMVDVYAQVEVKEQIILDLNESLKEFKDKIEDMECMKEQERSRMARESEEKDNDVEACRERYKAELERKVSELENCEKRCIVEKEREIQDLKSKYMHEMDKKDKDIEQILKESVEETDKLNLEIEELKIKLGGMVDGYAQVEEKEQTILQLKESLKEVVEKFQVIESTKDQERRQIELKLVEKEQLILLLNEKLKDIEGMLQKKEDEQGQILQSQKEEAELQLEIRHEDIHETKQTPLKETEKNAESTKLLGKLTHEEAQIQNDLALKEAEIEEMGRMQGKYVKEIEELRGCVKTYKEMEEGYRKDKAEIAEKLAEKDKDLDQMRLIIEQTKAELNELTQKMEKEMTSLIQEYERGIQLKNEEIERILKEKEVVIIDLERDEQQKALAVKQDLENSQMTIEELERKIIEEMQKAEIKCEQMREECEEKDKQLSEKQSEFDSICKKFQQEIVQLGTINSQIEKERGEMKEDFERQVAVLKDKLKNDDDAMKKELAQKFKEIEIWVKEKHNFEEKVQNLERKEDELAQWEMALVAKHDQLEKNDRERQKAVQQKERQLEHLLKALEDKQMELSFHGEDLQKKVRGLKDQGRELKDKEYSLKNQEQELINLTSQLEARNEHVSFTTQQLDEMGKDLASLKQELRHKDQKYRTMFDNLNKWEVSLREREAQLNEKRNRLDYMDNEEEIELMYQDIGETRKDRVHEMAEFASTNGNDYHVETLKEIAEVKEGPELRQRQDTDGIKVISSFKERVKWPQNNKETGDLTILMLREAWSSRSPSGVSILGGEEKDIREMNGLRFRSWSGAIAGRQVSIVEPVGLKWQDCTSTSRENILEAVTWCESVPSVVLLVLPVFLTCTESYKEAIEEQVNSVGSDTWRRAMVLFTWGETLGVSVDQHIQRNAELNKLIARCGGRYHAVTGKKNNSEVARLFEKMDDIVALNKGDVPK